MLEVVYEYALTAARPVLGTVARTGRAARAVRGRSEAVTRLESWAAGKRDSSLPLVWVHSPSVGEALMAEAIIGALRSRVTCQVVFTFFSPSAERMADRVGADVGTYLPWDVRADIRRVLSALDPAVLAFVRTEVWPTLVREASMRGVRITLLNAPLAASSSRLRPVVRSLLRASYRRLDLLGAVSADDAERFGQLGVERNRVRVTGDARFDQVLARVAGIDRGSPLLQRLSDVSRPTIVAGSTWPADERMLIAAFPKMLEDGRARLVVAPHEPTDAHIDRLERELAVARIDHARLADLEQSETELPDVVIVDRIGVLADIYAIGQVAYVGGGFGRHGLHSVIEPAALGLPVLFGPEHGNAREAGRLLRAGGGFIVTDAVDLATRLTALLDDAAAAAAARDWAQSELGGAEKNASLIRELLEEPAVDGLGRQARR